MDEDEQYPQSRDELLGRFKKSLGRPLSERFFDEDDLIEIFDYAGDINDDYLRMEALMVGARFFPNSHELLERRGIFYSQYSDYTRAQFLNHRPAEESMILDLLDLRNDLYDAPEEVKVARFDTLVASFNNYSDEEVIQLVETVQELKMLPWLKANMDMLRSKAEYVNGLLFESAAAAESLRDFRFAASLLEELTEAEPFNPFFWLMLSKQYAELEKLDKALEAIDYSIAIKADSAQAMLLKARYLYSAEEDLHIVENYAMKAIELSNGATEPVRFLAMAYHNDLLDDKACNLLQEVLDNPNLGLGGSLTDIGADPVGNKEFELIPDLIAYGAPNADKLLDRFYAANDDNNVLMWSSWASQLAMQGHEQLAKQVSECYERNSGATLPSIYNVEQSFYAKRYDETLEKLADYLKEIGAVEEDLPEVMAMHILSLVRKGDHNMAMNLCNLFEAHLDVGKYGSVSSRLAFIGLKKIFADLRQFLASGGNPKKFDPLKFWN